MHARWLGWAGVELRSGAGSLVIDPLVRPEATYQWMGARVERFRDVAADARVTARVLAVAETLDCEPGVVP